VTKLMSIGHNAFYRRQENMMENQSTVVTQLFGTVKTKELKKILKQVWDRMRANDYAGTLVTMKQTANKQVKYEQGRYVPKKYMWIGQFLKSICHTRATLTAADNFLSYNHPKYPQNSVEEIPMNFYTSPEWFGPMIAGTTFYVVDILRQMLLEESKAERIISETTNKFYTPVKRRLDIAFANNVTRDILETITFYGMDPKLHMGTAMSGRETTQHLHSYHR